MSIGAPVVQVSRHRARDWVVGALLVVGYGLLCAAAALGVAFAVTPLFDAAAAHVARIQLGPWALGAVLFAFFFLLPLGFMAGALITINRISRGGYRRFFVGLPLVALTLTLFFAWPELPENLPHAVENAESTIGSVTVSAVIWVGALVLVFALARRVRR